MLTFEGIKQCVVLAKERKKLNSEDVHKYLIGYYVSDNKLDENLIMKYLKQKLTDYMVPSLLIHLNKLPITINGKLDMKALPDRDVNFENNYREPRNDIEKNIQLLFSEILGIESNKIGIQDDFFLLGGDSIVSIQLASKIREKLGYIISIKNIFKYKTIESIYDNVIISQINNEAIQKLIQTEQGLLDGKFDLLPIQKWFLNLNSEIRNHWNLSFMIKIPSIDLEELKIAMKKLVEYHDAFRIKFQRDENNNYYQYYDNIDNSIVEPQVLDLNSINENDLTNVLTNWQSKFNIENGPLYNYAYLYGYNDGSCRLWFSLHHLIIDTVSWRIILDDLKKLYHHDSLPLKGSSYRQWINTINNFENNEKDYWSNIINDMKQNQSIDNILTFDKNIKNIETFSLNEQLTEQLLRECNKTFNTNINDLLLTALGYSLAEITNNHKNYILLEGHGREDIDDTINISRTMGWFTSMYPVCLNIDKNSDFSNNIINNKESLRLIPNKGVLFGKYFGYGSDLPKITFNYSDKNDLTNSWDIVDSNNDINANSYLDIKSFINERKLEYKINSKLNKSLTNKLANELKNKLVNMIDYCLNINRSYLTSSDISHILDQKTLDIIQFKTEIENAFVVNNLQEGFIYYYLKQSQNFDAYIVQNIFEYNTEINSEKLFDSWKQAKKRFSALRSRFSWDDKLIQIIDKYDDKIEFCKLIELDNNSTNDDQDSMIKNIQKEDRLNLYKLDEGNLLRIFLIKKRTNKFVCLFSHHHSILDGWSIDILLNFVNETYLNLINNNQISLQYQDNDNDYKNVQNYLQSCLNTDYEYWNTKIEQIEEKNDLKVFLKNQLVENLNDNKYFKNVKNECLKITNEKYDKLKQLTSKYGLTSNAIFQFIWHKIFSIYSNTKQTIIGTTISGRNIPINNIDKTVGCFINTLPLIVNHSNDDENDSINKIKEFSIVFFWVFCEALLQGFSKFLEVFLFGT